MKFNKLMFTFATLALAVASAASNVTMVISQPTWVGGTQLKPGDYKVQVDGNKAVIKFDKKQVIETSAKIETGATKYDSTTLELQDTDGKRTLKCIRVGGTNNRIVFQSTSTAPGNF